MEMENSVRTVDSYSHHQIHLGHLQHFFHLSIVPKIPARVKRGSLSWWCCFCCCCLSNDLFPQDPLRCLNCCCCCCCCWCWCCCWKYGGMGICRRCRAPPPGRYALNLAVGKRIRLLVGLLLVGLLLVGLLLGLLGLGWLGWLVLPSSALPWAGAREVLLLMFKGS